VVLPVLDAEEQRVLGCLLEKQVTVPDSYPLSLNGLRSACNQSSSREPVVDWDEPTVEGIARRLRHRELVRVVWADKGRRTLKYHQLLTDVVELPEDQHALLTVLLLRGPQAPGELRTRTERMHVFADRSQVEAALARMAGRGIVAELPRRAGERDSRWTHLLGATEAPPPSPVGVSVEERDSEVLTTYGGVACDYADALVDELDVLPFERWLLEEVASRASGPVVEVGCGPGHVTAFLAGLGADASGLDLTPEMVAVARQRFPDVAYAVGDLRQLMRPTSAPGWSAVLAWYSLIHLSPDELPEAVASLARPLAPGGQLVIALHTGGGTRRVTEWFGHHVGLTFVLHDRSAVLDAVRAAGLSGITWYHRGPVADRGETSERLYVLASQV
jgi:uncharacterized protein YceH (UPF0502 family)/SAM-dependent methyltransferase